MKNVLVFMVGVVLTAAVALVQLQVPLVKIAALAAGLAALAWLLVIVVLPWNLVFQARHVLEEAERSRARGLRVDAEHVTRATVVHARMWKLAVALHLGTAALLGLAALVWGDPMAAVFSGLFLISTICRPAVVAYGALKRRLSESLTEVAFPRDDVVALAANVRRLESSMHERTRADAELTKRCDSLSRSDAERQQQLEQVARRFEQTVDRLTDNRELVSGLKAFVRLLQRAPEG